MAEMRNTHTENESEWERAVELCAKSSWVFGVRFIPNKHTTHGDDKAYAFMHYWCNSEHFDLKLSKSMEIRCNIDKCQRHGKTSVFIRNEASNYLHFRSNVPCQSTFYVNSVESKYDIKLNGLNWFTNEFHSSIHWRCMQQQQQHTISNGIIVRLIWQWVRHS